MILGGIPLKKGKKKKKIFDFFEIFFAGVTESAIQWSYQVGPLGGTISVLGFFFKVLSLEKKSKIKSRKKFFFYPPKKKFSKRHSHADIVNHDVTWGMLVEYLLSLLLSGAGSDRGMSSWFPA